jgi:glycolate oxidase
VEKKPIISQKARAALREILGADLADSPEALTLHGYDAANVLVRPDMVAYPRDAAQIAAVMRLANAERFPVVPRGAGAGFSGGALAVRGGLILNLGRLNRILAIDEENLTADVEPGVITGVVHAAVEERGLFYPPDPASSDYCSIGGNIAENAGGPRAFKYGVTEHYVLGLEVITPTGALINAGGRTIKNVAGYNLLKLFIGSEGTLGIVTRAVLRLIPKPKMERTARLFFADVEAAARTVSAIIAAKVVPATIELMDGGSLRAVRDFLGADIDPACGAMLLVRVDGHPAACEDEAREVAAIARAHGCIGVAVAGDETQEREIWRIRKSLSPAVGKMANTKLNEDVVVPRSRIPDLVAAASRIGAERGILIVNFGHAGDGNIHVNFMYDRFDPRQRDEVVAGVAELMRIVVDMGGAITGEHGVGIMKSDFLGLQYDRPTLDVMRALKRTLDPNNILNPGKIFPDDEGSGHVPAPAA